MRARHTSLVVVAAMAVVLLLSVACSSAPAASAPSSTSQPQATKAASTTQSAAPTAAAQSAAKPTDVPAKKVDFPTKGRSIRIIVPFAAGGGSDIEVRTLQPYLEKELGVPVEVENKGGAGMQVGITEAAQARPDGYTIGNANWPAMISLYLEPDRKAAFNRKSFQAVALHTATPEAFVVKADSPYKTLKDLIDAAKQKPGTISVGNTGLLSSDHLGSLYLQKQAGTQFNIVSFDGAGPAGTALLGGHIDVLATGISSMMAMQKSGQVRFLAFFAEDGKKVSQDVPTMAEAGYKGFEAFGLYRGFFVPANTPQDVVAALDKAMKVAIQNEEQAKKLADVGQIVTYKNSAEFSSFWDEMETTVRPAVEEALKSSK